MKRDSRSIRRQQVRYQDNERIQALRALLMTPLMVSSHDAFPAVLHHADTLRTWFSREAGWTLHIERDCARLYKRPAQLEDASRGLPGFDRRRYVLLCLVCAVLERANPQITLKILGERLLVQTADPALIARDFSFTLTTMHERRELVAVCRTLLELGVLRRIAGDEESYVRANAAASGETNDALYDVHRRALAGMLAAIRGPSTWPSEQAPVTLSDRLDSLVREYRPDTEDGQRTALRHHLARRLLDDPVVYLDPLTPELRSYFINQRGAMASRLCEASGLQAEQRAEGLALTDIDGDLSDIAMPAEGTEAHVTLLVAEFLAQAHHASTAATRPILLQDIAAHLAQRREQYGRYWRKSAREAGSEHELAQLAVARLRDLQLLTDDGEHIAALPALARFALGSVNMRPSSTGPSRTQQPAASPMTPDLFS
ncbi:TIGR02678 family protein [Castellaniella sp.]|uniref:TIGR02678 family protein n=1 Tax=Castellaniella sp. TaxID=1955812 RepID=UPI002AFF0670|nr:TIGR02678 family protein [Castellaniella sp.]